jgi:hypothetical protein
MRVSKPSNQTETSIAPQIMRASYDNESDKVLKRLKAPYNVKISVVSISIISSFTITSLAINCSSIICHSISSIPVEGEYQPSLKDCLITCGSSSEVPTPTSIKAWSTIAFIDFCPQPLTLVERGARATPVFFGALAPRFPFLAGGTGRRGSASTRAGTTHPSMIRRASAFEEKPNNTCEQMQ